MPVYKWSALKSRRLKKARGASFDDILKGEFIEMIVHPNQSGQKILLMWYRNYVWASPCVETEDGIFLKTLYPSRKYTKWFKEGKFL